MTIKRNINGTEVEIELTPMELAQAYMEEQHNYDVEDIRNVFDGYEADFGEDVDAELVEYYGKTLAELEALVEDMAKAYRRALDNSEEWAYCRDAAIEWVLRNV